MKNILILVFCISIVGLFAQTETIKFPSEDGIEITADLYKIEDSAPWIILHHQAGFSRGAYLSIAPKLNKLGFNCIATDQRSGKEVNEVINQTHLEAEKQGKETKYVNAIPDLIATLNYVKSTLKATEIIIWGSSYSSALTFYMGSQYPDDIKAILAFSPGEYFEIGDQKIGSFAAQVKCPVFITSAKSEEQYWRIIYDAVPGEKYFYLPQEEGFHGSRALWPEKEGHELVWVEVEKYLERINSK